MMRCIMTIEIYYFPFCCPNKENKLLLSILGGYSQKRKPRKRMRYELDAYKTNKMRIVMVRRSIRDKGRPLLCKVTDFSAFFLISLCYPTSGQKPPSNHPTNSALAPPIIMIRVQNISPLNFSLLARCRLSSGNVNVGIGLCQTRIVYSANNNNLVSIFIIPIVKKRQSLSVPCHSVDAIDAIIHSDPDHQCSI